MRYASGIMSRWTQRWQTTSPAVLIASGRGGSPRLIWLRKIAFPCAYIVALLLTVWTSAALYFDLPVHQLRAPAALLYLILVMAAMLFFRRSHRGLMIAVAGFI